MAASGRDSANTRTAPPGAVGWPLRVLRSEGLLLLVVALAAYFTALDEPLWLVPTLLFVPDLFMVGYARSSKFGAVLYNAAHAYPGPALLGGGRASRFESALAEP